MAHCLMYITVAGAEEGARIGRALVEERLAACANVIPAIRSIYRWQGAVQDDQEALLLAKTRRDLAERVTARVKELHSYTVPAVLCIDLTGGNADFLRWVDAETEQAGSAEEHLD